MSLKTAKSTAKSAKKFWEAVGRRKTATANVRLFQGQGDKILINNKNPLEYFNLVQTEEIFLKPLEIVNESKKFNLSARVKGGGKKAQIEAVRLGIARALIKYNSEFRPTLKREGLLTRDPREKERKKPGLKRARRAPQWSKR